MELQIAITLFRVIYRAMENATAEREPGETETPASQPLIRYLVREALFTRTTSLSRLAYQDDALRRSAL